MLEHLVAQPPSAVALPKAGTGDGDSSIAVLPFAAADYEHLLTQ